MTLLPHPTHARTSRIAIAILFVFTAISVFAGFYLANRTDDAARTNLLTALVAMGFGLSVMLVAILRGYICRCAKCGSWLTKQVETDTDDASRKFACDKCNVVWDSKVVLSVGGGS